MVESSAAKLDQIFHALADSTRRSMLRVVAQGEHNVTALAKPFAMSLAAVSKHLAVLEKAQLVSRERRGNSQIVHLNPATLQVAEQWLAEYTAYWSGRLDALQHLLEDEQDHE